MRILPFFISFLVLLSCKNNLSSPLTTDFLAKQVYRINNKKDTVLKTAGGALLQINRESFSNSESDIVLEVKEAYSFEEMVQAGLTTQSDDKPLRSAGMISIDAADKNVRMVRPMRVSLPAKKYDVDMKLFKGQKGEKEINWVELRKLNDTLSPYLQTGKQLFEQFCTTCHAYDRTIAGPPMKALESRGPWKNRMELLKFTVNPSAYIPHSCYTKDLASQYNGQLMPSFPMYEETDSSVRSRIDLNAIYDYLKNEDLKHEINLANNYIRDRCDDSCYRYDSVRFAADEHIEALKENRRSLIDSNEKRINYNRWNDSGTNKLPEARDEHGTIPKDLVEPEKYQAIYYRFDITSFGWYNIDDLLDVPNSEWVNLKVQVDETLSNELDVFLAIPRLKTFDHGGKLKNGMHYGFFTRDGKIKLPIGEKGVVFALGEANGKIIFDHTEFVCTHDNSLHLLPKETTKEAFNDAIKRLTLEHISVEAKGSKNAAEIQKVDGELSRQENLLQSFRPKTCNCNCDQQPASSSSIK